ncbi:MAG: hypothetical protein ACKOPE_04895 [Novosphingobium sp.]
MSALILLAAALAPPLPEPQRAIALAVAAPGRPHCTATAPDGTSGPCLPVFTLSSGGGVNARTLGDSIRITRGAARKLSPQEFALLAAHEVAHSWLGHDRSTHANELAADRLGAELACRAGFDPLAGLSLYRHLRSGKTHPPGEQRRATIAAVPCPRSGLPRR